MAMQMRRRVARNRDYDAHSPMFRNRHFSEERRSKLFNEYPHIWGRGAKFAISWAFVLCFWSSYYVYHKTALNQHL